MGELRCVDGSILSVAAVACRDRAGRAYEITLELSRDSSPVRVGGRALRPPAGAGWPTGSGPRAAIPSRPRVARSRRPVPRRRAAPTISPATTSSSRCARGPAVTRPGSGELRCTLRSSADWIGECAGLGGPQVPRQRAWPGPRAAAAAGAPDARLGRAGPHPARLARVRPGRSRPRRRVLAADPAGRGGSVGRDGIGLRAVLTSAELVRFLDTVLTGPDGCVLAESAPVGETTTSGPHHRRGCNRRCGGARKVAGWELRDLVYRLYERRLEASLSPTAIPRHVGVISTATAAGPGRPGSPTSAAATRRGADKIFELLEWCAGRRRRGRHAVAAVHRQPVAAPADELEPLLRDHRGDRARARRARSWQVKPVGALDLLPDETARVLKDAAEATAGRPGLLVNVAVGYGGRREIADAVRSLLQEHATRGTTIEELAEHPRRRAHRRAPLHRRPARPGPGHPHLGRAAPGRLPAVAERALGVLLLRRLLARLPPGRLPARAALVRGASPPIRCLTSA